MTTEKNKTENPPAEFKSVEKMVEYLNEQGWKCTVKTVYNHRKAGKIRPDVGKRGFSLKAALKYASNNLPLGATLQKKDDEDLGRTKTKAEIARLEEQTQREKLKRLKEQGEVIEKAYVYQQFAALIVGLENAAKGQANIDAEDAVDLIFNADNKAARFVEIFNDIIDRALNEMARVSNIEIIFGESE